MSSSKKALHEAKIEALQKQLTTAVEKLGKVNRKEVEAKIKDLEKRLEPKEAGREDLEKKYEAKIEEAKKEYAETGRKVVLEENNYQAIKDALKEENQTFFVKREASGTKQVTPHGKVTEAELATMRSPDEWLGKSIIRTPVYHGTNVDISTFKKSKYGSNGPGIYFTTEKYLAEGHGSKVITAYVKIESPKDGKVAGHEVILYKPENIKIVSVSKSESAAASGGGGAAMRAPSSKPRPGGEPKTGEGEGQEAPKNPVWPGAPNDFVPHIEMPELVRLAKEIMGKTPLVARLRSNMGIFVEDTLSGGKIKLDPKIFKDTVEATKLLAHEIGHLVDWLPDQTLARGNVLGRLKTLQGYRKTVIDPLPTADDALDPLERNKLRSKAIKEALSHTDYTLKDYIKNAQIRQAMKGMIKDTYEKMVEAEIQKRGLITKEQVSKELKAVTNYWHPFDPALSEKYTAYRYSARELYAEAISMLFNEPVRLKEMAPTFYKTFWANIGKKPEVEQALLELDELLASGAPKVLAQRQGDIRTMFKKGEEMFYQLRKERSIKKRNLWLTLKEELIDKNVHLIEKVKQTQRTGKLNPEDNPLYYLEEFNYIGGKIHNLLDDVNRQVMDPAAKAVVSQEDIGEYLFDRRVLTERADIANPLGQNRMTAGKQLEYLLAGMNNTQKAALEDAIKKFQAIIQKVNQEAIDVGMYTPEIAAKITTNDAYSTFQVLDYLNDYVSAGIIHQVGTFKEIANPFVSTVMKLVSVTRAIERVKTKKSVVKFMSDFHPDDIRPAEVKVIGTRGNVPIMEFREKEGFGIIAIPEQGNMKGFYVDPHIADSVNYSPTLHTSAVVEVIKWLNRSWFRPIYINFNLGFQTFNFIRDFTRGWKLNPGRTFGGHIMGYFKAAPEAANRVWGKDFSPMIREMQENGMLGITYNDLTRGITEEETQADYIMRKWGVGPGDFKQKNKNPFMALLSVIEDLGNFIETLPKVVGYQSRMKSGLTIKEIAHEVRVYSGSPDFLRKGKGYHWYNEVFLFSNAIKEGIRGDLEGAFKNPRTRAGYWWKTTEANLIPKLLMFLGAAGFLGKKIKDNFDRQTEYDKTNYITLPLGETDNGLAVYGRIVQDEMGRLIGAIFWKMLTRNKDVLEAAQQAARLTARQDPAHAPAPGTGTRLLTLTLGR